MSVSKKILPVIVAVGIGVCMAAVSNVAEAAQTDAYRDIIRGKKYTIKYENINKSP